MKQRLFILGASGNVGRELIHQVATMDLAGKHLNPTQIVGVANTQYYHFDSRGIDMPWLEKMANARHTAQALLQEKNIYTNLADLLNLVKADGMDGEVIFVDVTAGQDHLFAFHQQVITQSNNGLVTANKNPISLYSMDDFQVLTKYHHRYDTNTTVMGGAGAVNFINDRYEIKDKIYKIEGCFSGTLGFIISELEQENKSFSQIVRQAKDEGYTEPNPWDDLNGLDVARKLLILARYAGYQVHMEDIQIKPLIHEKYSQYQGEAFFTGHGGRRRKI